MQAGSGVGLAITNAISDAVIHSTGSHLKGYQVGLWIGFAVTLLCVLITLVFVPSKAALEQKRLAKARTTEQGKHEAPEVGTVNLGALRHSDLESGRSVADAYSDLPGTAKAELVEAVEAEQLQEKV